MVKKYAVYVSDNSKDTIGRRGEGGGGAQLLTVSACPLSNSSAAVVARGSVCGTCDTHHKDPRLTL